MALFPSLLSESTMALLYLTMALLSLKSGLNNDLHNSPFVTHNGPFCPSKAAFLSIGILLLHDKIYYNISICARLHCALIRKASIKPPQYTIFTSICYIFTINSLILINLHKCIICKRKRTEKILLAKFNYLNIAS